MDAGSEHGTGTSIGPDTVQQDMFTVLHGKPAPVVTRWTYRADDPFAVTLGVRTRQDRWVEWLVARDLVIGALEGPTGIGDVRMSPQHVQGYDIVEIEIRSTDGRAVLEVDRDLLSHFVTATLEIVPVGEEAAHLDLDDVIARLGL
jgi:Streptomyces sporulation and cell division protein, SsgA